MNRSWRGSRIYEWRGWVVLLVGNYKVSFKWRPGGAIGRWGAFCRGWGRRMCGKLPGLA